MGVKNLWDVFESCKKTLPLHHLQNKRICVDLSCWVVQLQTASKSNACLKDRVYLRGLFHRLRALIALNCSLIFVSDGAIPAIKLSTYRRRLNLTTVANQQDETTSEKASLQRNKGSEFSCMINEAKILGMALGIPCLDGIEEAEAQCALLNSESLCDGCFSSDSDIFLFGARTVYRDICLGDGGYVVCYEMSDIERQLGFGRNSLITLGLILGSDYSNGVQGLGRESACQIVKSIGDDVVLQKVASEGLSFAKKNKKKVSKKVVQNLTDNKENSLYLVTNMNGAKTCSAKEYSCMEVVDAYLKPKCHSADSDAVYRVLVPQQYQHVKVQQVCGRFFEWPSEKTDEYMLPKIAERELRRFANLRSTSSEFGVDLPLEKMPVKCPVSGIIKQRKVNGNECYEVSWHAMHGLKSSVVPADLIQSACPEKIVEFEEEKAQKKKQNRRKARAKKPADESSMSEVEQRLQNLLLDIESESNTIASPSLSSSTTVVSETGETAKEDNHTEAIDIFNKEWESCSEEGESESVDKGENEIINLLSPSPPRLQCRLAAKQQGNAIDCALINVLSDSETEISPEHSRKARELRLFLAGIKD